MVFGRSPRCRPIPRPAPARTDDNRRDLHASVQRPDILETRPLARTSTGPIAATDRCPTTRPRAHSSTRMRNNHRRANTDWSSADVRKGTRCAPPLLAYNLPSLPHPPIATRPSPMPTRFRTATAHTGNGTEMNVYFAIAVSNVCIVAVKTKRNSTRVEGDRIVTGKNRNASAAI